MMDEEMKMTRITPQAFHGEWNYVIRPTPGESKRPGLFRRWPLRQAPTSLLVNAFSFDESFGAEGCEGTQRQCPARADPCQPSISHSFDAEHRG
jgi:hypothetical protein